MDSIWAFASEMQVCSNEAYWQQTDPHDRILYDEAHKQLNHSFILTDNVISASGNMAGSLVCQTGLVAVDSRRLGVVHGEAKLRPK